MDSTPAELRKVYESSPKIEAKVISHYMQVRGSFLMEVDGEVKHCRVVDKKGLGVLGGTTVYKVVGETQVREMSGNTKVVGVFSTTPVSFGKEAD